MFYMNEQVEADSSEGRAAPRFERNMSWGAELEPSHSSLISLMNQQTLSIVTRLQVHSEKPSQHFS